MMHRCGTRLRDVLAEGVAAMVDDVKSKLPIIATMDEARALTVSPEVRDALRARVADVLIGTRAEAREGARLEVDRAKHDAGDAMVAACEARATERVRRS